MQLVCKRTLPMAGKAYKNKNCYYHLVGCVQEVVEAADAVIAAVDETALAKHLARKTPEEGPGAAARKKEAEEQKAALLDALEKKASALLELHPTAPEKSASAESPGEQVCPDLAFRFTAMKRIIMLTCV